MQFRKLGATNLAIAPLVLGGNVFGWTADRNTSFAILDAFLAAGFNAIDTADVYSIFVPGHTGGESETVIGEWIKDRGVRDRIVLMTKGGLPMGKDMKGLSADYLPSAVEASLKRLQTDHIDLYFSHQADAETPIGETLEAYGRLIDAGKIRWIGASNYSPEQLGEALEAGSGSAARYTVFQPHYSLAERSQYEGAPEELCASHGLGVITYFSLASGFLTGKYRKQEDLEGRARGGLASAFFNERGLHLLAALDTVAARHGATQAQVALAWLMARPSVTAPIASATNLTQLSDILGSVELNLTPEDFAALEI